MDKSNEMNGVFIFIKIILYSNYIHLCILIFNKMNTILTGSRCNNLNIGTERFNHAALKH